MSFKVQLFLLLLSFFELFSSLQYSVISNKYLNVAENK